MSEGKPPPSSDQLMQEAAAWFARMRGPEAEANRGEFDAWLRRGALHRGAYNRAAEIFAMGKLLSEETPDGQVPARRKLADLPAAVSLLVLAGLCSLPFLIGPAGKVPVASSSNEAPAGEVAALLLVSAPGEVQVVRLADGSAVRLAGDTIVEVRLGPAERRLDLRRGEARFQVFAEPRPFVVRAGGGSVTALGTLFDVALSADRRVTVRLIEGSVEVGLPPPQPQARSSPARRLRAGETFHFVAQANGLSAGAMPGQGARSDVMPASLTAVRDYRDVSVADLIAAANRGATRPILLADPATGQRRVSGRFRIDDTSLLAERLALLFGLTIEHRPSGEIVLRNR